MLAVIKRNPKKIDLIHYTVVISQHTELDQKTRHDNYVIPQRRKLFKPGLFAVLIKCPVNK